MNKKLHQKGRPMVLTAAVAALVLGAGLARAQQTPQPDLKARTRQHVDAALDKLGQGVHDLHLTDAQKTKLRSVVQENLPSAKTIWLDPKLTTAQKKTKLLALRGSARGVLTADQTKKLETLRREALASALTNFTWVVDELDLSEQQQVKVRDVVFEAVQKSANIGAAKDGKPNYGALRGLVEQTQAKVDTVLTPEQQGKWKVIKAVVFKEVSQKVRAWRAAV